MEYDDQVNNHHQQTKRKVNQGPTPEYRKVYAPRPPPGFKVFDHELHFKMHYGNGILEQEIDRARRRALDAAERPSDEYESPLGKGFKYPTVSSSKNNPKSGSSTSTNTKGSWKTAKRRDKYDYAYYDEAVEDDSATAKADRALRQKQAVVQRMKERRRQRISNQKNNANDNVNASFQKFTNRAHEQNSSCAIM